MAILRCDIWASTWRRAIRRAGCASGAEPSYSNLLAPGQRGGAACLRRGDILAILPWARIVVLDCVVTHPAAASYARVRIVSSVMARAINSRRWLVIILEGWVKRQPASSLTSLT